MSSEDTNKGMNVESLQLKVENQQKLMKQLSGENEELYQQFNHLMIRNNKLLKRIDDLQGIIDDLHIRIEELQLINGNILKLNDKFRSGNDNAFSEGDGLLKSNDRSDNINDELKNQIEFKNILSLWKNYPNQDAKNEPNLRKQAQMLLHLYHHKSLRAVDLFTKTGIGGVTGARYVAALKKFDLIRYKGARKKGQYEMTEKGIEFIETARQELLRKEQDFSLSSSPRSSIPPIEQQGIPVKEKAKEIFTSQFNHGDH